MELLVHILLINVARYAQGLDCYYCTVSSGQYNGYPYENCLHPVTSGVTTTPNETCLGKPNTVDYCLTTFVIEDGVITEALRDCAVTRSDHELNTAAVPSADQCLTQLDMYSNPTGSSTCYFPCTTDYCNIKAAANVLMCASNCNSESNQGSCNYITGKCVCTSGYNGADCATPDTATPYIPRKCVQCNTETDKGCRTATTAVNCPGQEKYCSTTTTWVYDSYDNVVKTVTTRGCTRNFVVTDECRFTDIFTDSPISDSSLGYEEVTCFSTCSEDRCNTNNANGMIDGDEYTPMYCVQCDYENDSGCDYRTARTVCPRESTHCKSTVRYLISEVKDVRFTGADPFFTLRSVVRECATEAVIAKCTEVDFGTADVPSNVKSVTCEETCQWDGCNTGWPARPKCVRCTSSNSQEYDDCIQNPSFPRDCDKPYENFCYIYDTGIEKGVNSASKGYPRRFERGCSHYDRGTLCSSQTPRDTEIEECNRTCTTDGCNVGSGGSMSFQTLTSVLTVAAMSRVL